MMATKKRAGGWAQASWVYAGWRAKGGGGGSMEMPELREWSTEVGFERGGRGISG